MPAGATVSPSATMKLGCLSTTCHRAVTGMGWMLPADRQWASPRPAASLLDWRMPCFCSLCPLPGVLALGLCHSPWPMGLMQPGRGARRDQHPGPVLQTISCPVTLPQDCFQLLLSMGEAVCFLPIFPTLFPKENCTGRGGWGQAGILKPRVPALLQGLRGVLCHSAPPQRLQG